MKYISLLVFFILQISLSYSQKVDTVINTGIYKSYYSFSLKEPVFVIYHLYKGGGDCNRKGLKFKGNIRNCPTDNDYRNSGYDKGHLVPFEDFANNCQHAELTFRYYNTLPQTPNLNRGVWKMYEYIIRKISQSDSLIIITGGSKFIKKIGNDVYVPDYCWKLVYSISKKVVIYALYFKNEDATLSIETITTLEQKLGYNIRQYLK
jgi:DNA/RNA endonuclease G (NUC1)